MAFNPTVLVVFRHQFHSGILNVFPPRVNGLHPHNVSPESSHLVSKIYKKEGR